MKNLSVRKPLPDELELLAYARAQYGDPCIEVLEEVFRSRFLRAPLGICCLAVFLALFSLRSFAQPAVPSQSFGFPTNFQTAFGGAPIAYTTNLISEPVDLDPQDGLYGSALILDTTNLTPAFLNYNIIDTNYGTTHRNIFYASGTLLWYFAPNWASVSQGGTGPGETACFIGGGDWSSNSPNGLFTIYVDADGSNLYFGGVGDGDSETYASAPISWSSNTWHQIGVEYTGDDCEIYLDGALAATGDGVIYVPTRSTWSNGFFIGSDNTGFEQDRGALFDIFVWGVECGGYYTNSWPFVSNALVAWQATLSGGFGGMMTMGMGSGFGAMMRMGAGMAMEAAPGYLDGATYSTNYAAYTNLMLTIGPVNLGGPACVTMVNTVSNISYVLLTNNILSSDLSSWPANQIFLATNSSIEIPPFNPGSNALFLSAAMIWSTTTNGLPDWWQMTYFGNLLEPTNGDFDGDEITDLQAYTNGTDPNIITFTISCTNQYVNLTSVPLSLGIQGGVPYNWAVTLDNTNFGAASWTPYTSSNITANLGTTPGWHTVWVGLRGLPANAQQTWNAVALNLSLTPPTLVVTNATNVTIPLLQLAGYANEELASLTFDLANANGSISNQTGFMTGATFDTNSWSCTNVTFKCFDLALASGVNTVTLHASDLAGNLTNISLNFTLNYSNKPPPVIQLYWPQDGTQIGATNFTLRGVVDDPTVFLSAEITDTNGDDNIVAGVIERNGNFWVENIPLFPGPNYLTLTATDINTNVTTTNITLVQSDVQISIAPITDNANQPTVYVSGTINDTNYVLWVNGVAITNFDFYENTYWWSANNVPMNGAGRAVVQARAIPNTPSDNNGNGAGNGGGGANSTLANPGNPTAPDAMDVEIFQDKPAAIFCAYFHDRHTSAWQYVDPSHSNAVTISEVWFNSTDWSSQTGGTSQSTDCSIPAPIVDAAPYYRIFQWQWDTSGNGIYQQAYTSNGCGAVTNLSAPEYLVCPVTFPGLQGFNVTPVTPVNFALTTNGIGVITQQAASAFQTSTGGLALPGAYSIHEMAANAVAIVSPTYGDAYGGAYGPVVNQYPITYAPINPEQVTIFDQPEGSDGIAWTSLPNGEVLDPSARATGAAMVAYYPNDTKFPSQIYFGGTNATGRTIPVTVGQQISLTCMLSNGAPPITSYKWTVPKTTFSNYTATVNSGILATNFPTTGSNVTFYWEDGGQKTVTCSNAVLGKTNSCSTTFNVRQPNATIIPSITGLIRADTSNFWQNGPVLYFGGYLSETNTNIVPGIQFQITNADTTGSYFFVQIGTLNRIHVRKDVTLPPLIETNGPALDASIPPVWPYPFDSPNVSSDSPYDTCYYRDQTLTITDCFTMTLMYSNFSPHAVQVPLKALNWNWSAQATNIAPMGNDWVLVYGSATNSPALSTNVFPQWTSYIIPWQ